MQYPKDYEEAKMIIKNSTTDDYAKSNNKKNLLRAGIISSLCFASAAAVGLFTGKTNLMIPSMIIAGSLSLTTLFPIISNKSIKNEIDSGRYFEGKSESDIMRIASNYVTEYNSFEKKRSK